MREGDSVAERSWVDGDLVGRPVVPRGRDDRVAEEDLIRRADVYEQPIAGGELAFRLSLLGDAPQAGIQERPSLPRHQRLVLGAAPGEVGNPVGHGRAESLLATSSRYWYNQSQ
jgi:hypothetical protein